MAVACVKVLQKMNKEQKGTELSLPHGRLNEE